MSVIHLPLELQIMITDNLSDPCDLLAVRLTHPRLNNLLSERFSREFPPSTYVRGTSYASVDSMLLWAAEHNYYRFVERKLLPAGAWIPGASPSWDGLREAAVNAAYHGNGVLMFKLDAAFTIPADRCCQGSVYEECLEVAIIENHLSVAKCLIDKVGPDWFDETDNVILMQTIKFHRPEILEYMQDFPEFKGPLAYFYTYLLGRGEVNGWCQRILYILLKSRCVPKGQIPELFLDQIEATNRRNCGQECEVWFGGNRMVEKVDIMYQLRKLQRGEHISI